MVLVVLTTMPPWLWDATSLFTMATAVSVCCPPKNDVTLVDLSCEVPIDTTAIKTLYIFVEIAIDSDHLSETIRANFPDSRELFRRQVLDGEDVRSKLPAGTKIGVGRHLCIEAPTRVGTELLSIHEEHECWNSREATRLALVSTIQFVAALARLKDDLTTEVADPKGLLEDSLITSAGELELGRPRLWKGKYEAMIPRSKPLSPGEILGCTSPHLTEEVDAIMYVTISIILECHV